MAIRIDERLRLDEPSLALAARSYFLRTLVEGVEFFIVADDSAAPQHVPVRYGLQHIREEFKILRRQRWTANALPAAIITSSYRCDRSYREKKGNTGFSRCMT
jgi:hypothetical protein